MSSVVPASFRGVPINVTSYSVTTAPLTKVHLGVGWTNPKIENLGKAPLVINVEGFLCGDFALLERAALQAQILSPGNGLLTIPTYGVFYGCVVSSTFNEDLSNIIEFSFEFIQTDSPFGSAIASIMSGNIPSSVADYANEATATVTSEFTSTIGSIF